MKKRDRGSQKKGKFDDKEKIKRGERRKEKKKKRQKKRMFKS